MPCSFATRWRKWLKIFILKICSKEVPGSGAHDHNRAKKKKKYAIVFRNTTPSLFSMQQEYRRTHLQKNTHIHIPKRLQTPTQSHTLISFLFLRMTSHTDTTAASATTVLAPFQVCRVGMT